LQKTVISAKYALLRPARLKEVSAIETPQTLFAQKIRKDGINRNANSKL
jgi:hypothetical protein